MTQAQERTIRIAQLLYRLVKEVMPTANSNILPLARGIALQAQLLKLSPAAFDSENGHDALAAIAHAGTRDQLLALAHNNAHTLNMQWAKIVNLVDLKLAPIESLDSPRYNAHRRTERDDRPSTWPPKLFDGWIPRGK